MPDEQVPPVVAVVVSQDSGPWLEECLRALAAQDYANLSVLVIDAASEQPIAARVAAVVPEFFLHRVEENHGFGPSANVVGELVQGATYYLFCHDDVRPEPDALRRLVEEAFRSNAGVTGPKLVDATEPDRILQLGLNVDRFGAPVRRVEHREFDQAQHDAATEVFAVPGACTLVRSDLFATIGGYDPEISMFGEDVDLCWRARLAGARVVVAPAAVVGHAEATSSRQRPLPESRALQWRHELRAVLKNYGNPRRPFIVGQLAVLSVLEVFYFFVIGRRDRMRQVYGAWRWNLTPERGLRAARAQVRELRRLPDREVCSLLSHRTFRLWRSIVSYVEARAARLSAERRLIARTHEEHRHNHRERRRRDLTTVAVIVTVLFVFGARSLLIGHLPLIGDLLPIPSPTSLLARYFGGYDGAGSQSPGPVSPAFALLGLAGFVTIGAMGVLLKIGLIICVVAGPIGIARLLRPFASALSRFAGAICYLFLPLCWNALSAGDVPAMIAYGGMPFILARLLRATGEAPFGEKSESRAALIQEVLGFALLLALLGAFVPYLLLITLGCAIVLGVGAALSGSAARVPRLLGVTVAALVGSIILLAPWSITFFQTHTALSALTGAATAPDRSPVLGVLLRLYLGPIGKGLLGWAFLAGAIFVLVSGGGTRLTLAIRMWTVLLGFAAIAWAASTGWLGPGNGSLRVLLAPLAVALATLVGLGAGIVSEELSDSHLGWHHIAAVGFVVCFVAGLFPVLSATLSGRFSVPDNGYDDVLSWTAASPAIASSSRLLWLGDPASLPGESWQVDPGFAVGLSEGGLPDAMRMLVSANPGTVRSMTQAILAAASGTTVRLGSQLAPYGIRYLVIPAAPAPLLAGASPVPNAPPPQMLLDALSAQSDLHELPTEGGAVVFENTAWHPGHGSVRTPSDGVPGAVRVLGVAAEIVLLLFVAGYFQLLRRRRQRERRRLRHRAHEPTDELPERELVPAGGR